jgi:ribosome-binding protein aMBF1 (putative translation factor)
MMSEKARIVTSIRESLKLSPQELADALNMGPRGVTLIRKWESGKAQPTSAALSALRFLVRIERLEDALAMSLRHLNAEGKRVVRDVLRTIEKPDHLT